MTISNARFSRATRSVVALAVGVIVVMAAVALSSSESQDPEVPSECATIDGVIDALYDVVSGPAGTRWWIVNLYWAGETAATVIPERYLSR